MKRIISIIALVASLLAFSSCKPEEEPLNIIGTWSLSSIQTKSANLGGQPVDIYVTFNEDNSFQLYQKIGQGRYTAYTGTWSLLETTLDGKYSDGTPWGSSYQVSQNDDRTTLTLSSAGEDYSYVKGQIPADIENQLK